MHRITDTTHLSLAELTGGPDTRVHRKFRSKHEETVKLDAAFALLASHLQNAGQSIERTTLGGYEVYQETTSGQSTNWIALVPEHCTLFEPDD